MAGFVTGLAVYAIALPGLELWANANSAGELTLPRLFGVPYGVVVLGVVVLALAAFAGAEWAERRFHPLRP